MYVYVYAFMCLHKINSGQTNVGNVKLMTVMKDKNKGKAEKVEMKPLFDIVC